MNSKGEYMKLQAFFPPGDDEIHVSVRHRGARAVAARVPIDFTGQNDDYPHEPSSPLKPADLSWLLYRNGWRVKDSDWEEKDGWWEADITPGPGSVVTLSARSLVDLLNDDHEMPGES